MSDNKEPKHLFRVQLGCGHGEYIAADFMIVRMDGAIQLEYKAPGQDLMTVAVIFPSDGLSVVRVDTLITTEGLKKS